MQNFWLKILVASGLVFFLSWSYLFMPQAFFSLDNRLRDFMFVLRGELPKSQRITIVDIDEASLKAYGQWPWSRDLFAKLLYRLSDAGAGIIGLDIVFAEEDRTSPHRFAQADSHAKNLPNYDQILASSFGSTPVVGGYIFTFESSEESRAPNIPATVVAKGLVGEETLLRPKGVVLNIPLLQDALYSSGFFNNTPDEGGMIRHVPLIMEYDGVIYPSLALEMIRIYQNSPRVDVRADAGGVESIRMGELEIPTDNVGRLVVNFRGPGGHFEYISAKNILDGTFDPKKIDGRFVLIGTSAVGLFDLRSIPFDSAIAGVEVHANAIDNILEGDFISKPSDVIVYDLMLIAGVVAIFWTLFTLLSSWAILPAALMGAYGVYELLYYLLFKEGIVVNILFAVLAFFLTLVLSVGIDYIIASRQKEQAKRMLGKKVSPAVMEYLLAHSTDELVRPKDVEATIFFSDIRSFTTMSERIGSPSRLIEMLNAYMTPMVNSIVSHHGTIDKFIGDAIMAYWNAPVPVKNHADEALKSAIEQIEMLPKINEIVTAKYGVTIEIGIGLHTGVVTAGDMGSQGRSDYTIIGDNVNLASRLEGLTKQYGASILISHATYEQLQGSYTIRPIDLVEVKGKSQAVEIFEVICSNKNISQEELGLYTEAIGKFRAGEVVLACEMFEKLDTMQHSKLYGLYIERCRYFISNPLSEFTPILKMTTK